MFNGGQIGVKLSGQSDPKQFYGGEIVRTKSPQKRSLNAQAHEKIKFKVTLYI